MVTPIISNVSINRGTCPHGNPIGACPICNGGGGGGGAIASTLKKDTVQGGMTWNECFAYLRMVQRQKQNMQDEKQFQTNSLMNFIQNNRIVQFMAANMATISTFLQINIAQPITNFANRVFSAITSPIANLVKAITNTPLANTLKNLAEKIQKNLVDISNKIASMIGEPIMAAAKFISDNWQKLKAKKFMFFSPVDTEMEQGDQDEEIELKRWLGIKTLKESIEKLLKSQKDNKEIAEWL
ncbi:MAG: hypothetical protein WCF95_02940 [bacterium]